MPRIIRTPLLVVGAVLGSWVAARLVFPASFAEAVGMVYVESVFLPPVLWFAGVVGGWELLVAVAAWLDWREAKLTVVGWRQAWAVAHVTLFVRTFRRARWIATGLAMAGAQTLARRRAQIALRDANREYVVLDPAQPFDGVILEQADKDQAA